MHSISKKFVGTTALEDVDFNLNKNEVHCLVGENGAGKSTLIKILSGVYQKDSGSIFVNSKEVNIINPFYGRKLGISVIYQELDLISQMNVAENIFLGNELITKNGIIDWKKTNTEAEILLNSLGINLPVDILVKNLSVAQRQFVATARALSFKSKILVMDEPSTVLSGKELDLLYGLIQILKNKGLGIIYISHRLDEIFKVGDRITILRDGQKIREAKVKEISLDEIVKSMVGREIKHYFFKKTISIGEDVLTVKELYTRKMLKNININLRKGEIIGIFGLVGSGRTELARALIGADSIEKGEIFLNKNLIKIKSPSQALKMGIGLVPEDRKLDGLLLSKSIEENISITIFDQYLKFLFINYRKLYKIVSHYIKTLNILTTSMNKIVEELSGGNQQKVVLAKWMASKCKILIMDEPTKGIDVGAKAEIYHLIYELVSNGISIIFISSEMPEILSLSDKILVMSEGQITAELSPKKTTQEEILKFSLPKSKR